jgi:hypothetical protein
MNKNMMEATCESCAFVGQLDIKPPVVICMRHAPRPHEVSMGGCVWMNESAAWPKVQAKWRCGEWEER